MTRFITIALDVGVPPREVQDYARHARTTRRYHSRDSLDRSAAYLC